MAKMPVNERDLWFDPQGLVRVTYVDVMADDLFLIPFSNVWDQFLPVWFCP